MRSLFTKSGQRILALWFPRLASDRILRQREGRSWRSNPPARLSALIISRREENTQRIAALDERAEGLGLKRGTGIADARAMHPSIEIVEADPDADRRLLESLADWCDRYTPLVAIDGSDGLFLDITGCSHLFGGEEKMMEDVLARLFHQGFDVRAGLASSPGAAWAAARFLSPSVIPPGEEAKILAPLPLSALRIEPAVRSGLESAGLYTMGSIMHAPRAPLARRFGAGLLTRLDQALGQVDEAISPRLPVPPLSVERQLADPVTRVEDIENLAFLLSVALRQDLERRGEGADALQLALFRVDGAVSRQIVRTSLPVRDPALIRQLFREKLMACGDEIDAGYGFELVRLSVLRASSFEVAQADLAGEETGEERNLALFADRVRARLGEHALMKPALFESHIPERASRIVPFAAGRAGAASRAAWSPETARPERPIRLFSNPEPVEVIAAEVPEGPPLHFRWRRVTYRVARAEGPERIAAEWWRTPNDAPTRDYFRVEDAEGRRYWLYRQGLYGVTEDMPRWFVHGIFA